MINKIKNYNQIILAIAGTLGLILLSLLIFLVLGEMSRSLFIPKDSNNGILAVEKTNNLLKDSLRKQIISFNRIQIIDSLNQTYLLPVTQANLADAESTDQLLGLLNTRSVRYKEFSGNIYNNLIIHNSKNGVSKLLFDTRVSIENFRIHESQNKKYIIIPACSTDSNKDEYLNDKDLQELFIYSMENDKLSKIEAKENYTTLKAYQPSESENLIVHFGIDRNKNGIFEGTKEPMVFYKVNLNNMQIEEFVSEKEINKLQKLLEGN